MGEWASASNIGSPISNAKNWVEPVTIYRKLAVPQQGKLDGKLIDVPVGAPAAPAAGFPSVAAKRKALPVTTGVLDYFPLALLAIAECSKAGNDQHNPGKPLHWSRGKSNDHADALGRHLLERGTVDTDGIRHSAKVAWRALAILQLEIEEASAPKAL